MQYCGSPGAVAALAHVITRADGTFESWSETLVSLAAVHEADMPRTVREWVRRIVHPDDRSKLRAAIRSAQSFGRCTELQYRILRVDGAVAHVRHVIDPIEGEAGGSDRSRWFSTLQDVSRQTLSELHVRQLNDELEQRVCERTAAAESANRAKSDFLSNLSHELRTPLNAILGFGQLLAQSDPAVPHHKRMLFAEQIVKTGQHVLTLINETLDLARIEAGKLTMHIERVALSEVLDECVAMIEPLADRRRIRLAMPTRCGCEVAADRTRLKQVLLNLLSNAVKYDKEGGTVCLECDDLGEHVRLAVHDTGPGMKADDVNALFQPFSRPGQEGRGSEGTGMGLVITRRLMEAMGGQIGVSSSPGKGSTFWIEIGSAIRWSPRCAPTSGVVKHQPG